MRDLKDEAQELQKEMNRRTNDVKEQNKKIIEINDKLYQIDDELKDAQRYQKGIDKGFWAFFPNIFNRQKKTKKKECYKDEPRLAEQEEIYAVKKDKVVKDDKDKNFDELMNEINGINREATELKQESLKSKKITDDLHDHVEDVNTKIIVCNEKNKRILKK